MFHYLVIFFSKEITRAKEKNQCFDFAYFIIICKLYKLDSETTKKKKKHGKSAPVTQDSEILWSNPEEELFDKVCIQIKLWYINKIMSGQYEGYIFTSLRINWIRLLYMKYYFNAQSISRMLLVNVSFERWQRSLI